MAKKKESAKGMERIPIWYREAGADCGTKQLSGQADWAPARQGYGRRIQAQLLPVPAPGEITPQSCLQRPRLKHCIRTSMDAEFTRSDRHTRPEFRRDRWAASLSLCTVYFR